MTNKCVDCVNSRIIISENGIHYSCTLSSMSATYCMIGIRDKFEQVTINKQGEQK